MNRIDLNMEIQLILNHRNSSFELSYLLRRQRDYQLLHHKFQKESIHSKLDTIGKKSRKENLEKEMDQIENDIKKLSKNYIFVDTTAPSTFM